jgi:hypothetical protein
VVARLATRVDGTIVLVARRVPGGVSHVRPDPDGQRIAALLLAAHNRVARCKNTACEEWFTRTTAKRDYCSTRCCDRRRSRSYRRRRGVAPAPRKPRYVQAPPRSADGAFTHADWQKFEPRAA